MVRAFVGAGGKTTCIHQYAKQLVAQGKKVFVTTSTHMLIEEDTLLTDSAQEILEELEKKHCVMAGIPEGRKITELSRSTYEEVCRFADEVLIEADGSKHFPLKYPNDQEPVIYENVDEIVVVFGMHGLGLPAKDSIHRFELARKVLGIQPDTSVEPIHIQQLLQEGYVKPLKAKFPNKTISIIANGITNSITNGITSNITSNITNNSTNNNSMQRYATKANIANADRNISTLYERAIASLLEAQLDVSLIQKEWFGTRPKFIICGGGHVAYDLAKMAEQLDFSIKVLDDREEFANRERFPMAEEVICDSFDHLDRYLDTDAYYVIVTRGHKEDYSCVKTILNTQYRYLGMIGSKLKVARTLERLREEGINEEAIATIHAPIGLDIKAITPAEIAVSILAQIILEKNSFSQASASQELLNIQEHGTLCIVIGKTGSTPRGVGSMMFVNDSKVIDTIGGGTVEYAVIEEARKHPAAMVKEYHLDTEKSRELGMICGGSNWVLFLPV